VRFWRQHHVLSGVIGAVSWSCMVVLPMALNIARADPVVQEAGKGRDTGANLLLNYRPPTVVDDAPPADPASYRDADGKLRNEVWSQELFPGYNPSDPAQLDALKSLKNDPQTLTTQGVAKKLALGGGADETSRAYQALGAASANPAHAVTDMRAEPFLDVSREIIKGESSFLDEILMSCEEATTDGGEEADRVVHMPEIVSCAQAPVGQPTDCRVTRNFVLEPVETRTVLTVSAAGGTATGNEHWVEFGYSEPLTGASGVCLEDDGAYGAPDHPYSIALTSFYEIRPWPEPEWGAYNHYAGAYCGTHAGRTAEQIQSACQASANYLEGFCRNLRVGGATTDIWWYDGGSLPCSTASGGPPYDYTGCPPERQPWCQAKRDEHYAACVGTTSITPMNGTATLTAPALGVGGTQTGVALLGTTVNLSEDPFDPTTHGLAAGEYVIASHVVSGTGVTAHTILSGGNYAGNWDYQFEVSATDAESFSVEATLYRIAANDFTYSGCTAGDVANVTNGTCGGTISCAEQASPCRDVNGVPVCEGTTPTDGVKELLQPWTSISSTLPALCWAAEVQIDECTIAYDCIGAGGCAASCEDLPPELQAECLAPACWIDANGEEVCLDSTSEQWVNNLGEPGYVDNCEEELRDPQCRLLPERTCVEGMEDPDDPSICLLRQVYFDCGKEISLPGQPNTDTRDVKCAGNFRCFGDECAGTAPESNPDFAKASTAATMITEASKDISCAVEGDPSSCRLFEGTRERCRDPQGDWLGLLPDCCKDARKAGKSAGSFMEYMQLAKLTYELAQKPMVASYLSQTQIGTAINSAIGPGGPIAQATGAVKSAISSGFNSALQWAGFTPVQAATEASSVAGQVASSVTGFGPIQQFIATGVKNFLQDIGMEAFADSLFSTTAEGIVTDWAVSGLGQMVGAIISIIGWIYLIYQIVKILASLIFKCKDSELSFGVQMVNRMCHYVGAYCSKRVWVGLRRKCIYNTRTYCCFASPLSRIMVEQMRAQGVGPAWGSARRPNCEGVTIAQVAAVDWSRMDLSEWEAILFEAGLVPDPRNPPTNFIPTSIHAGVASGGPGEGLDSATLNREAINAVMGTMDEGRFLLKSEPMGQTDPELMPWYGNGS
jgi:hypothetical protein